MFWLGLIIGLMIGATLGALFLAMGRVAKLSDERDALMHTKDMLADELRKVGLTDMADRAATGWYHDFLSPLDFPETTLVNDLAVAAADHPAQEEAIMILRKRVIDGDFDANLEESDAWADSAEGQATFGKLIKGE